MSRGAAGTGERLVESNLLYRVRSGVASWHGNGDELLLEYNGVDCYRSAEKDGAFGCLINE